MSEQLIWAAQNQYTRELYLFSDEQKAMAFIKRRSLDFMRAHEERGFSLTLIRVDDAAKPD